METGAIILTKTNVTSAIITERDDDTIWYDTIRYAILTCAQKLTQVSLIYHEEPTTKKWEKTKK